MTRHQGLLFLKLGGSLITDKNRPHTPKPGVLERLASEIATALDQDPDLRLVLGHGSGSFGHVSAKTYGTRQGVHTPEDWQGFIQVWQDARVLNHLVTNALTKAGLPAITFSPCASVTTNDGQVVAWDLRPIKAALDVGLLPIVYGDVIFDTALGGTILSTEDLFVHLAKELLPRRILIAGEEEGVWIDYPHCSDLIPEITPENLIHVLPALGASAATDVTGGMLSKVRQMLKVVQSNHNLEVSIFSGAIAGTVQQVLLGEKAGTRVSAGN